MISQLYEYIIHGTFILGGLLLIVSFLLSFIPLISGYRIPVQVIGILLFSVGIWFESAIHQEAAYQQQIAELKVKLADARAESEKVSAQIVTKVVTQRQTIREKGKIITETIEKEVPTYINMCEISPEVVKIHNAAVLNDLTGLK